MGNTALIEGENKLDVGEMSIEAVQAVLENASVLTPEIREKYAERLLGYALESRDPAASAGAVSSCQALPEPVPRGRPRFLQAIAEAALFVAYFTQCEFRSHSR